MESYDIDKFKHVSNNEVVRRLLIKYFMDKGCTTSGSFDRQMYPAMIQDISQVIPVLSNKVEVVPYAGEVDPALGRAVLGWNLFVLGNNRMFLGETYHNNLHDLARQIRGGNIRMPDRGFPNARRQTTPKRVISFITRILHDHEAGYVDLSPTTGPIKPVGEPYGVNRQSMLGMPQQFYTRSGGLGG